MVGIFVPEIPDLAWNALTRGGGIGLLLGWYLFAGRDQIRYVKETWQDRYPRRPWTKPLLVAVGCLVAYFIAIVLLSVAADVLLGVHTQNQA